LSLLVRKPKTLCIFHWPFAGDFVLCPVKVDTQLPHIGCGCQLLFEKVLEILECLPVPLQKKFRQGFEGDGAAFEIPLCRTTL
jgi:hypothetical protein